MSSSQAVLHINPSRARIVGISLLAWLAYIGLDFLLNAGILARIIDWQQPGLLSPMQMFQRIPLGYLSFLLATILMVWLMLRMNVRGLRPGLLFGTRFGLFAAAIGFSGLLSIVSIRPQTLLVWSLEAVPSCALVGAVVGDGLVRERVRKLVGAVIVFFLVCVIVAAILQNVGATQSTPTGIHAGLPTHNPLC